MVDEIKFCIKNEELDWAQIFSEEDKGHTKYGMTFHASCETYIMFFESRHSRDARFKSVCEQMGSDTKIVRI